MSSSLPPGLGADDQRLLLDASAAARLLSVSERHLRKLHAAGQLPRPIRLGRSVRWSRATLERWIELGCPSRERLRELEQQGGAA